MPKCSIGSESLSPSNSTSTRPARGWRLWKLEKEGTASGHSGLMDIPMVIEQAMHEERKELLAIAVETGLFDAEEAEALLGSVLDRFLIGGLPDGHSIAVCRDSMGGTALGWTYYAPDAYAEQVWNIWWIGVAPSCHGKGVGQAMMHSIEREASENNVRVIVVETSDGSALARARSFYRSLGYGECGVIPNFYGAGDSKVIFSKSLLVA